jgi:hypothetical protein
MLIVALRSRRGMTQEEDRTTVGFHTINFRSLNWLKKFTAKVSNESFWRSCVRFSATRAGSLSAQLRIASTMACESRMGTISPLIPGCTKSFAPLFGVSTTCKPHAMASRADLARPSSREGRTKTSALCKRSTSCACGKSGDHSIGRSRYCARIGKASSRISRVSNNRAEGCFRRMILNASSK